MATLIVLSLEFGSEIGIFTVFFSLNPVDIRELMLASFCYGPTAKLSQNLVPAPVLTTELTADTNFPYFQPLGRRKRLYDV